MAWQIPLADLDFDEAEFTAVEQVLHSRWLTMGEQTQRFEHEFAKLLGVKHAFAVANGTVALHLAYAALGLGVGDEVLSPALTFVATTNAILYTGATPVFSDITSLDDLTVSPTDLEARITPRTRAIAVMHYGGYPCNMPSILDLARKYNLAIIEDAAHAPGATCKGQSCGTIGDVGCFSFFSNKNLAIGEGGMVVTNRDDLAEKLRLMRSHGMTTLTWDRHRGHAHSYDVVELGYNYRLDEMRAALGIVQLHKLLSNNQRRAALTASYRRALTEIPEVTVPFTATHGQPACHILPILLRADIERATVIERMKTHGIQTSIHYPPIHLFTYYRQQFGGAEGQLPLTEAVGKREVTLPLYPTMTEAQVAEVVAAVRDAVRG